MASTKICSPPVLDKINEIEDWLHEIKIWQCVTDIEENSNTKNKNRYTKRSNSTSENY